MKKRLFKTLLIIVCILLIPFPAFAVNEGYIPIHIDGYFDDWTDKAPTEVYPGKNPPPGKINYVKLFRDESKVYVYVQFAYKNNQDITNMIINLYTNMGDENYFLVPDYWFDATDMTEQDMAPRVDSGADTGTDSLAPDISTEENGGTGLSDQGPSPEQGSGAETAEPEAPADQKIYANLEQETYMLVADNINNQGNNAGIADTAVTSLDDVLDQLDPSNPDTLVDPEDILDEMIPDATTDSGTDTPTDSGIDTSTDPGIISATDSGIGSATDAEIGSDINSSLDSAVGQELQTGNLDLKKPGHYGTWSFTVWSGLHPVGSGFYTREEGEPDQMELFIPLSSITHHYDGITEITMKIKKLGPQMVMCAGADTEPYLGVVIGAGIAMLSAGAYFHKKKQSGSNKG